MDFTLWSDSLLYPRDTFRAEKGHESFGEIVRHILISGLIYAGITGFIYEIFSSLDGGFLINIIRETSGRFFMFFNILLFPIIFLLLLFFISLLIFISARIFKGYGDFLMQTYFLSSIMSSLILFSLLAIIPFIGKIMFALILLYSIKPIIIALKVTHGYDTKKAFFTLFFSFLMLFIFVFIFFLILWQSGIFIAFDVKNSATGFENIKILNSEIHYKDNFFEFSILNSMDKPLIIANIIPSGDCSNGLVDLDRYTGKIESFITLSPEESTKVKIFNCSKKLFPRGRFSVPLRFQYQEKIIGAEVTHFEQGVIEGLNE